MRVNVSFILNQPYHSRKWKSKYFNFWQSSEKKKAKNSLFEISLWLMQTRFQYIRQMWVHCNWEIRPWRILLNFPNFVADVWSLMFYSIVYMTIFNLMRLLSWYHRSTTRPCSYPLLDFFLIRDQTRLVMSAESL